jgi:hypothetical protein
MNVNRESNKDAAKPSRVCISHARSDRDVAEHIALALRAVKFDVWFDSWQLEPGDSITTKVREGLSASDFLLVLLSPASVDSHWVRDEITLGLSEELRQRSITVVPALIKDCDVPPALQSYMRVDLRGDRERGLLSLIDTLTSARDVNFAQLSPRVFEALVADLFRAEGFAVTQTSPTQDGGHDLLLRAAPTFALAGTEPSTIAVQVKHYKERRVSVQTIREVIGSVVLAGARATGLIVSSSQLTSAARELVSDVNNRGVVALEVIEGPQLKQRVLRHPDVVDKYFRPGGDA